MIHFVDKVDKYANRQKENDCPYWRECRCLLRAAHIRRIVNAIRSLVIAFILLAFLLGTSRRFCLKFSRNSLLQFTLAFGLLNISSHTIIIHYFSLLIERVVAPELFVLYTGPIS